MKTALIIHGHFYQPPRENPFTGVIPLQASAKPYENWNESIYRSCYLPNAFSRYLDSNGGIVDITNNYSRISFNFGPTLLSWLEEEHPQLIEKLREADRENMAKTGHSNVLAQCYNHTILPLDNERTKRIEVAWAIEDYKHRFGHKPEGFWCSECAINEDTVDVLADFGIKYTVLSPWQASAINGVKLAGKPAPCDRPFIIKGKRKSIAAFFYDPDYASGISFGHLLRSADSLYKKLEETIEERENPALLHWATDGEIYGHHEPFGDMALAALIKKIDKSETIELTNYGAFLEQNPPTDVATLSKGDDGLGSSWSCSHGVGRWFRDCGCFTGGDDKWNQKWRTPLRKAFRNLQQKADAVYYEHAGRILGSQEAADNLLLQYGSVVCNRLTADAFLSKFTSNSEDKETLAILLDAMKNVLFSFSSCGWFFNDISGIEPRQDMMYALYAAQVLQEFTGINYQQAVFADLKEAKSNIASEGTGEDIAKRDLPNSPAFAMAAGFFAANRQIALKSDFTDKYGAFRLVSIGTTTMEVENTRTLKHYRISFNPKARTAGSFHMDIKNKATGYSYSYVGKDITPKTLKIFSAWVDNKLASCLEGAALESLTRNIENYSIIIDADKNLMKHSSFIENMSLCIKVAKCMLINNRRLNSKAHIDHIRRLAWFARTAGMTSDIANISEIFNTYMERYATLINRGSFSENDAEGLLNILITARSEGYNPDITLLQDAIFPVLKGYGKSLKISEETLRTLAGHLNISFYRC